MIESMRIKGFRGFEDLHVTGIKPVTLFGGSNNAGKSSVLEAVLLHGIVTSENYFLWLANMRNGSNNVVMKPQYVWAPLFYRFAQTQELLITCSLTDGQKTELRLAKKNGTPAVGLGGATESVENIICLHLAYKKGNEQKRGEFLFTNATQGVYGNVLQSPITFMPEGEREQMSLPWDRTFYYKEGRDFSNEMVAEWVSKACLNNIRKGILLDSLQIFDAEIADIVTILDGGTAYVYIVKKSGESLPLRYMGDGINKAIRLILGVMNAENGIYLIDEIENGFYYNLYYDILQMLYSLALRMHCQLLIATHNRQIIQTSVEVMEKAKKLDQLAYQRMGRQDSIKSYAFTGEELSLAVEADMEVR